MDYQKTEKGVSFVEMIVAISIFGMGIAGFTMLFARSWKSNSFILEEGQTSMQAARSVSQVAAELRDIRQGQNGEYMVKLADDNELVVYRDEDRDGTVERVRLFLDEANDIFKKGVAEPSGGSYPGNYDTDSVSNLAYYTVNADNAEPLFRYYDNSNNEIVVPATPTTIRVIELNLWVNIKPLTAPDNVRIGTSVEIRNLDESI